MRYISNMILPLIILFVIIYAVKKKVPVYDKFIDGAKEGIKMGIGIFPYLLGMAFATSIILESNLLGEVYKLMSPILSFLKFPVDILPLAIIRPVSGNSALIIVANILEQFGPDSFLGRVASTLMGSSDTTIYILTLYFGAIGIKKIKYALWAGLLADLIGVIMSIVVVNLFF